MYDLVKRERERMKIEMGEDECAIVIVKRADIGEIYCTLFCSIVALKMAADGICMIVE